MKKIGVVISTLTLLSGLLFSCGTSTKDQYTVTLDLNYESSPVVEPLIVKAGEAATKCEDPDRFNYNFIRWCEDSSGDFPYNWNTAVTHDITLYATWQKSETLQYVVTFYAEDRVTVLDVQFIDKCSDASYLLSNPVKANDDNYEYYFESWDKPTNNIQSDLDVYPVFQKGTLGLSYKTEVGIDGLLVYVPQEDQKKFEGSLYVPAYHEGQPVVAIADQGLYALEKVTEIHIQEGISLNKVGAIDGIDELKRIYLPTSITEIMEGGIYRVHNAVIYFAGSGPTSLYSEKWNMNELPYYTSVTECSIYNDYEYFYRESTDDITIVKYIGTSTNVVMPDRIHNKRITTLGNSSFAATKIESVEIGYYVKTIDIFAFSSCLELKEVKLNASIQTISRRAFAFCNQLCELNLFNYPTLQTIGEEAFYGCYMLYYLDLRTNIKNMGYNAFGYANGIVFYTEYAKEDIPTSWDEKWNFQNYPIYYSVTTHDGIFLYDELFQVYGIDEPIITKYLDREATQVIVTDIDKDVDKIYLGPDCFSHCKDLQEVTISEKVKRLGWACFLDCPKLSTLNGIENVATFDEGALQTTGFTSFTTKKGITYGDGLLMMADSLITYSDEGNDDILDNVCSNCKSLTNVYLNEGTKKIKAAAFTNTPSLDNVVIPASLNVIEDMAFFSSDNNNIHVVEHMFYKGTTKEEYEEISINYEANNCISKDNVYYYSETSNTDGHHWHYVDNVPTIW